MNIWQIPILAYHKIEQQTDIGITTRSPEDFEQDIKTLSRHGYQFVRLKDLKSLPSDIVKPLALTFDDGYASVYQNAEPVLRRYGATATVFIPALYIGRTNDWDVQLAGKKYRHLNKQELQELHRRGLEIGAHGLTHRSFCGMNSSTLRREMSESKIILEKIIDDNVTSICYPFRRYNKTVLQMAEQSGYLYGIGTQRVLGAKQPSELALSRLDVYRFDSTDRILRELKNFHKVRIRNKFIQLGAFATIGIQKLSKDKMVKV